MTSTGMKSIWFFVSLILIAMGLIIVVSGIYQLMVPPEHTTVLSETHPSIWWGAIMTLFGIVLYFGGERQSKKGEL